MPKLLAGKQAKERHLSHALINVLALLFADVLGSRSADWDNFKTFKLEMEEEKAG